MNKKTILSFKIIKILEAVGHYWHGPIYVAFLVLNGLTLMQVNIVNTVFMIVKTITDIPTGNLGDRIGHNRVYRLGLLSLAIACVVYGWSSTIWGFILAEAIAALGAALVSDALETWLRNRVDDNEATKAKAYTNSLAGVIGLLPMLLVSPIVLYAGMEVLWYLSAITFFVTFLVARKLISSRGTTDQHDSVKIEDAISIKEALKLAIQNRHMRFVVAISFSTTALFQPLNMFWGEYVRAEVGVEHLGWYAAALTIGLSLGKFVPARSGIRFVTQRGLAIMVGLIGFLILLASLIQQPWIALLFFCLHEIPRGLMAEALHAFRNLDIEGNPMNLGNRATLNSVVGSSMTLGAVFGLLTSGMMTWFLTIQQVWGISAIFLILIAVLILRYKPTK